ncbi:MAG: hypothetical protein KZQ99_21815 [Candidatus Thiodiazotropha sp. (ex Dulcina madagascariensis)]|nr:hypothetical protein [Candidatus Thiodiazotropha sp. (ex Dulcina madagascariensis)]
MKKVIKNLTFTLLSGVAIAGYAEMDHNHTPMDHSNLDTMASQPKMFLEKKQIDGHTVSFHVMQAKEGMQHGGSHNLMVKVEKDGQTISDLTANSKVVYPDGKESSKMLMKMGEWYMAGYDLSQNGEHQLMVLFKTTDGQKHFGGVHYMAD